MTASTRMSFKRSRKSQYVKNKWSRISTNHCLKHVLSGEPEEDRTGEGSYYMLQYSSYRRLSAETTCDSRVSARPLEKFGTSKY